MVAPRPLSRYTRLACIPAGKQATEHDRTRPWGVETGLGLPLASLAHLLCPFSDSGLRRFDSLLRANDNNRAASRNQMNEFEQDDPIPQGDLALQITALPRETNGFGDIFGGWLVSQMDLAGTAMASKVAGGRVATVAIDRMAFLVPVAVGAQLSFYTQALEIGRSSIQMLVEVWSDDPLSSEWRKVTEAVFVFVAIDDSGRTRPVPARR